MELANLLEASISLLIGGGMVAVYWNWPAAWVRQR